ncbi:MAG: hypothetical protein AAGL49_12120, partial [Pseudomonadota bacterium]
MRLSRRPILRRIDIALWAVLALACMSAGAFAQAGSLVRVTNADGYTRLEFEWPDPTSVEARIENSVLVARFGRPAARDLSILTRDAG